MSSQSTTPFMNYGKTLLTNLFYILILSTVGGLWYVQYHHFEQEVTAKEQSIAVLETDVKTLKSELQQREDELLTQQQSTNNQQIEQYAKQLELITSEQRVLKQSYAQSIEALAACQKELNAHKSSTVSAPTVPAESTPKSSSNNTLPAETPMQESEQKQAKADTRKGLQCPSADKVNQYLSEGQWSNANFNWWVEFSFRPLRDNEIVKAPFQVLYDGTYIDCYYKIGASDTEEEVANTWIVIKGVNTDSGMEIKEGWEACEVEGCEFKCEYKNGEGCYFELKPEI